MDSATAIDSFLQTIQLRRSAIVQPPTFAYLQERIRSVKRRKYLLAGLLLASPWLYRFLLERFYRSKVYRRHRQRHESFTQHLIQAEKQQLDGTAVDTETATSPAAGDSIVAAAAAASSSGKGGSGKVAVNREFFRKLAGILRIVIPGWRSGEMRMLLLHSVFLVLRTYLSVVVARIDGRIVKDLVAGNGKEFLKGLGYWFAIAVPATYTNSMIRYLQSKLAIAFRTRLTDYVHDKYLEDIVFYKLLNLDSRIAGPDQLICTDISRFCDTLSSLYSNLAKPVLDTIIFNYQLTKSIGGSGMFAIGVNYLITAWILRQVTPGFGKLAAVEAKLEGDFRSAHSRLITNAEEIAFYHGGERECGILESIYKTLIRHVNRIYRIRIAYNMFEDFVIKYTWSAVGLLVCAVPVFFPDWAGTRSVKSLGGGGNASSHTQGFITNKRLMISLADAGGRIMYSYKELAELAGYTARVHELLTVLRDMRTGRYVRTMVSRGGDAEAGSADYLNGTAESPGEYSLNDIRGVLRKPHDGVRLKNVPIVTPSGDVLVRDLSVDVRPGMHILITGPNGVGKSAIVRIISGLWPIFRGTVYRPDDSGIMFIPQRPYLSIGTLRDQIIYPHTKEDMLAARGTDEQLMQILQMVHLDYLPEREGGFETKKEWKDVFSGGEKQRMNLARLFYHRPMFGVLDECTSAVSTDVEGLMYSRAKNMGITLITVSHRPSLLKHHTYLLQLSGENGEWSFSQLGTKQSLMSVDAELKDLETRIADEDRLMRRLAEINGLLGVKLNATKK